MAKINKYTGEVLTRKDIKRQEDFNKTKAYYDDINTITEDGLYRVYNSNASTWDNVQIKVDETSGEIIAMTKLTTDEYGYCSAETVGFSEKIQKAMSNEAEQTVVSRNRIMQALKNAEGVTVDTNGNIVNSYGTVGGALEGVEGKVGEVRKGILDLNGVPIKVEVNKDGTIRNIDEIIRKLAQIQDKRVTVTTSYLDGDGNRHSKYATGTYSAMSGMALVGEHGPEIINLKGGERIYNAIESQRIARNMTDNTSSTPNTENTRILANMFNKLQQSIVVAIRETGNVVNRFDNVEVNGATDVRGLIEDISGYTGIRTI